MVLQLQKRRQYAEAAREEREQLGRSASRYSTLVYAATVLLCADLIPVVMILRYAPTRLVHFLLYAPTPLAMLYAHAEAARAIRKIAFGAMCVICTEIRYAAMCMICAEIKYGATGGGSTGGARACYGYSPSLGARG
eukprot:3941579-Rhodomonas_salina.1